jgi:hypothetical protein
MTETVFRGRTMSASGLAVWLFTPGPNTDGDWLRYVQALREAIRETAWHVRPCAFQVIEQGSEDPNAKQRREIADAMKSVKAGTHLILVTRSATVRHALTAIHWLRAPNYALHVEALEGEGLAYLERIRPGAAEKVRDTLADLRRPG